MLSAQLSDGGKIAIPPSLRAQYNLQAGQTLQIIDTGNGILLQPANLFEQTTLDDVAGVLHYTGETVSIEAMEAAIQKGALESNQ